MPLPGNFQTITLNGTYVDLTGDPVNGTILFETTSSGNLRDPSADVLIAPIAIIASIAGGSFSTTIPTTNDPDIIPVFSYRVTESFPSLDITRTYEIQIPYDIASPFNIADLAPVGETQSVSMSGIGSGERLGSTVVGTKSTVEFGAIRWLFT